MKRFIILTVLIFAFLTLSVTAVYEPYGSYGPYGTVPYTSQTSLTYQNQGNEYGNLPYGPNYYRYLNQWGPFDFKLSRTVTNDVIADLIDNFEYEDADLLFVLADLNQYDEFDRDYVLDQYLDEDDFNCLNIDVYNTLADLDQYDRYDTIDLENLDRDMLTPDFLRRFDFADYQAIANANAHDTLDPITANNAKELDFEDLDCYDLQDYNAIARLNPNDKWDEIDFTDFDDLDDLDKIGRKRVVFFHPEDFEQFNLYYATNPRWELYAPYLYGPFDIPNGHYGYFPPLRNGTNSCYGTNTGYRYCDFFQEQGYREQGSFEFHTDLRFDNTGRQRNTENMYGSRRPQQRSTSYPETSAVYSTSSSPPSAPPTPSTETPSPTAQQLTPLSQELFSNPTQQKEKNLIVPLSIAALLLLVILLFLLKRKS